jgi:hypothetical protein
MKNSSTASAPSSGKVKSPSNTPEDQATTLGGFPPEKTEVQINDANDPSKRKPAPDTVHGV